MLDIKKLRENPEFFRTGLKAKRAETKLDEILANDEKRRSLVTETDLLKAIRNKVSKEIGDLKKNKADASDKIEEMQELGKKIKAMDNQIAELEDQLNSILVTLPNLPHESAPVGFSDTDNVEVSSWGKKPLYTFELKDHLDIAENLGILDMPRGAKISGSGFPLYMGKGARLERALINFMLDFHVEKHNYIEVYPPFLVNRDTAFGTGQLPKMEEDMYLCNADDLFLIPTAEVPVTNIHRDEIMKESDLPKKYAAFSGCFRREAGSYGKDTRGLSRLHQFNKVEMVQFTKPEESYTVHQKLLQDAEDILQTLGLHYRILNLCSGDLSFAAAKCYDIEVWAPGTHKYFEVSSVSNFEDFQARRANIRFRRESDQKVEFVHTLNGSGVATPRLVIAILETYQQPDGSVVIPEALRSYTSFDKIEK
ncbi:MAG: serine--tRNA ligase [Candidatus Marinimicrobia bacterium]|nr:serine--tRNA ligase [Candidatus Neomarinimicrobiota bacterium]